MWFVVVWIGNVSVWIENKKSNQKYQTYSTSHAVDNTSMYVYKKKATDVFVESGMTKGGVFITDGGWVMITIMVN